MQVRSKTMKNYLPLLACLFALYQPKALAFPGVAKDQALQACIEATAKKKGWTSPEQVLALKCHKKNIRSIDGLEKLVNLKSLSLFNNQVSEGDFSQLKSLEDLNIARNKIKSLALVSMPELKKLYVFSGQTSSLTLEDLPKLELIKANDNKMTSFAYKALPKMEKIYIFDNELEDIDIYQLPSMKYMDCRQNPMSDELYDKMDEIETATILHDGNADDW